MQNIIVKIQSFGDIITNSSSEVYCIYDRRGMEQVKRAITNIVSVLNPSINIDDHLEFELVLSDDKNFYDSNDEIVNGKQYFIQEFNHWCENKNNEQILSGYSDWLDNFRDDHKYDESGLPNFILEITPLTEIGKTLADSIWRILDAFNYEEIYT